MASKTSFVRIFMLAVFLIAAGASTAQDELRKTFLSEAEAALEAADALDAKLLAPDAYSDGVSDFEAAETGLERGRNIEFVRRKAAEAEENFRAAATAAELAHTALAQVMKSRQDAANAQAPELARETWDRAQREFGNAIRYLERGDLKRAKEADIEATTYYRDAELIAIKAQYLNETRQLLANAERARVGRYAPITLDKAKQLLANAERELNENRYDTDLPRSLARQANYEAKHAIYLSEIVRDVRDKNLTVEELVLHWEKPLANIASMADIVPAMSEGYESLELELIDYIESERNEKQALQKEAESNILRLADMEDEIRALDERLGGATVERAALVQRLETEERIKAQFEQVEKMFERTEARVFREGDKIILRLVGLTFDSGKASAAVTATCRGCPAIHDQCNADSQLSTDRNRLR
jgi:hypothetical protein